MNVNTSVFIRYLRFVIISKKKQKLREAVATIEVDPKTLFIPKSKPEEVCYIK